MTLSRDTIFLIVDTDPVGPRLLRIKVPSRSLKEQPYLAFSSADVAEFFMRVCDIDDTKYCVASIVDAVRHLTVASDFLIFRSGQQILDFLADPVSYDYESLIQTTES